jgi:hypothetical protein
MGQWLGGDFQWAEKHSYQSRSGNSRGSERKRKQTSGNTGLHIVQIGHGMSLPPRQPRIRFVKRAAMWCRTYADSGKTKQEWTIEKPAEVKS